MSALNSTIVSALLTAEDVAARLRCSVKHARGLMRRSGAPMGTGTGAPLLAG